MSNYPGNCPKLHNATIKNNQTHIELGKNFNQYTDYSIVKTGFIFPEHLQQSVLAKLQGRRQRERMWRNVTIAIMHSGAAVGAQCRMYRCFDAHLLRAPAVWNNVVFFLKLSIAPLVTNATAQPVIRRREASQGRHGGGFCLPNSPGSKALSD